jgi:hypothetical protein
VSIVAQRHDADSNQLFKMAAAAVAESGVIVPLRSRRMAIGGGGRIDGEKAPWVTQNGPVPFAPNTVILATPAGRAFRMRIKVLVEKWDIFSFGISRSFSE